MLDVSCWKGALSGLVREAHSHKPLESFSPPAAESSPQCCNTPSLPMGVPPAGANFSPCHLLSLGLQNSIAYCSSFTKTFLSRTPSCCTFLACSLSSFAGRLCWEWWVGQASFFCPPPLFFFNDLVYFSELCTKTHTFLSGLKAAACVSSHPDRHERPGWSWGWWYCDLDPAQLWPTEHRIS